MGKEVIRTAEAQSAIVRMSVEEKNEFLRLSLILHETGRLEYPLVELKKARKIKRKYGL